MANAGSRKVQTRLSKPIQLLVIAGLIASILASAGPAQARIDGGVLFGAAVGPSRRSGLVETEALLGRLNSTSSEFLRAGMAILPRRIGQT